nr:hypothetical protein [Bacillota bacterium]
MWAHMAGGAGLLLLLWAVRTVRVRAGALRIAQELDEALRQETRDQAEPSPGVTGAKLPGVYLLPAWVPAFDAGLAGVDQIQAVLQIDPRVVEGMDFWLSADLSDFSELKRVVADAAAGEGYDRWLDTLKGYVAEQVAADVLETSGAQVELAPAPNQAGWDLLVNGEPYNVKVGITTSHIAEHFRDHPDIGVITSPELAAQFPEHADKIIALPELSHDDLVQLIEGTIEGISGVDWDFSFPVITAIFSGVRELDLLLKGDTDLGSSARNLGLDLAGTGGGGWVGGKIGAAIGTAFGPAGTAVGGIVGALFGAFLGRSITNEIKLADLRRAQEEFQRRRADVKTELGRRHQALQNAVLHQVNEVERALKAHLDQLETVHRSGAERIKAAHQAAVARFVAAVPDGFETAAERVAANTAKALQALPPSPWPTRLVWPSQQDITREGIALWSRRLQKRLRGAADRIRRATRNRGPLAAYNEATAFLKDRLMQVPELRPAVEELGKAHVHALAALAVEREKLEQAAKRAATAAAHGLATFIQEETRDLMTWLEEQAAILRGLAEKVRVEMRRLGIRPADG